MECHNKAIELDPNAKHAYIYKGQAYKEWGKYEDAIHEYNRALELDPQNSQCYYLRGIASFSVGKHHDAIQDFQTTLQLEPAFIECYQIYGVALQGIVIFFFFSDVCLLLCFYIFIIFT